VRSRRTRQAYQEEKEGDQVRRGDVWRDFTINAEGPSQDYPKLRKITRETPDVLAVALETEDHKERWRLLQQYRKANGKRCALRSWTWLETALMTWDTVG
jgi:hypothetical protein